MLNIDVDDLSEMNEFMRNEKDLFFEFLIIAVKDGWENKLENVIVASFNVKDTDSTVNISIDNEGWYGILKLALYHFEISEKYEYCIEVKDLLNLMYGDE
tara:strand:- start:4125 stop:4424 length:300 start_codon:yes stop_codon:yes gene_type:complete